MAEFCLDCWNEMNGTEDNERKYVLSRELDFCENCGEWKHIIIMERKEYILSILFLPIRIIWSVIYFLWRLFILPYLIFRNKIRRL